MLNLNSNSARLYVGQINAFWNYTYGTCRERDYAEYSQEDLLSITPEQLVEFCAQKVYGVSNPSEDDNPTLGRSSWVQYAKKAISFFMPNRLAHWDVRTRTGNPTKSAELNDLIKMIKKKEVRKQGS